MAEVSLKDFSVGATAYTISNENGNSQYKLSEYRVISVGRKYVTVTEMMLRASAFRFGISAVSNEYLAEVVNYGWSKKLFPTKEKAEEYIEKENLRIWVDKALMYSKSKEYTLDQLRRVKAILEEKKEEKEK